MNTRLLSKRKPLALFLFAAMASACAPAAARRAQRHLRAGQFEAADKAADRALKDDPDEAISWRVKIRASMGLGKLTDATATYHAWKEKNGGHDRGTLRQMALTSLWQAMQVPSPAVKAQAIEIVERHEIEKLAEAVRDEMANDSDLVAATAAVAVLKSHPQAPRLAAELITSEDPHARRVAIVGIARKIGTAARADVGKGLSDSDASVRRATVSAMAKWKSKKDRKSFLALARGDSDGQIRARALRALLPMGNTEAIAIARVALQKDSYVGAKMAAVTLLEKQGDAADIATIADLVGDQDLSLALHAATAIAKRDKSPRLPLLQMAMESPAASVRASAVNSAGLLLKHEEALRFAGKAMADMDIDVRLAAARLLYQLGASDAADVALRQALGSSERDARLQAAIDLARRGDAEAIAALGRLTSTGDANGRKAAIAAHKSLRLLSDGLINALADDSIEVRLAAADALLSLKR